MTYASEMSDPLRPLRRALQALAQPAVLQRALFPEFSSVGDELARVFATAFRAAELGSDAASEACAAIEALFASHGSAGHADFWDDLEHPGWEDARELARRALELHGWPAHKPQPHDP